MALTWSVATKGGVITRPAMNKHKGWCPTAGFCIGKCHAIAPERLQFLSQKMFLSGFSALSEESIPERRVRKNASELSHSYHAVTAGERVSSPLIETGEATDVTTSSVLRRQTRQRFLSPVGTIHQFLGCILGRHTIHS